MQKRNYTESTDESLNKQPKQVIPQSLVSYTKQVISDGLFSDVTVHTKQKDYQLHRFSLARSSYFKTLFMGNWSDSRNSKTVDLSQVEEAIPGEVTVAVWDALFTYLYSDCIEIEGFTVVQAAVFAHLVKFFDLPIDPVIEQLDNSLAKLHVMYSLGQLDITDKDLLSNDNEAQITKLRILAFIRVNSELPGILIDGESDWSKIVKCTERNLDGVADSFMKKLVDFVIVPLPLKVALLYLWIKQNLKVDPKKDSAWRKFENASTYFNVVDSLQFKVVTDTLQFAELRIFDDSFMKAVFWKAEENPDFEPVSIYVEQSCESEEGSSEIVDIGPLSIEISCGESSSAYWWDCSLTNNYSHPMKVTLHIYPKFTLVKSKEQWKTYTVTLGNGETKNDMATVYGAQMDTSGVQLSLVATIERSQE
jgi:hypothetical protein